MCAICTEWEKKSLTAKEAFQVIGTALSMNKDKAEIEHLKQLSERIISSEVPETEQDSDLNQTWSDEFQK